jgi:hypothetical protein
MAADGIESLIEQAVKQAAAGSSKASHFADQVSTLHAAAQYISWGVLVIGLVMLIMRELGGDREPRFGPILIRFGFIVLLLVEYHRLVALITGLAGGGGEFGSPHQLFGWLDEAEQAFGYRFDSIGDIPEMILWLLLLGFLLLGSVAAYVVSLAISVSQGVLIAIALSLGPIAIAVSLIPGVTVGKGWAKFLAMAAAWTRIGGTIVGLMQLQQEDIYNMVLGDNALGIMMLTGRYFVLAAALGATPWITAALFNGIAAVAHGLPAFATSVWGMTGIGLAAGRQLTGSLHGGGNNPKGRGHGPRGNVPPGAGNKAEQRPDMHSSRPHKTAPSQFLPPPPEQLRKSTGSDPPPANTQGPNPTVPTLAVVKTDSPQRDSNAGVPSAAPIAAPTAPLPDQRQPQDPPSTPEDPRPSDQHHDHPTNEATANRPSDLVAPTDAPNSHPTRLRPGFEPEDAPLPLQRPVAPPPATSISSEERLPAPTRTQPASAPPPQSMRSSPRSAPIEQPGNRGSAPIQLSRPAQAITREETRSPAPPGVPRSQSANPSPAHVPERPRRTDEKPKTAIPRVHKTEDKS